MTMVITHSKHHSTSPAEHPRCINRSLEQYHRMGGIQNWFRRLEQHRMNPFGEKNVISVVRIPMLQNCYGYLHVSNTAIISY
jgi:hypothetical protein